MKNLNLTLIVASLLLGPLTANATWIFSNVQITGNSVTFTIDGDMTGYAPPADSIYDSQFSLRYLGDLWVGPTIFVPSDALPNTWSSNVFDNETLIFGGNTVTSDSTHFYSWSLYDGTLSDAVASNRTVNVSFGADRLNPLAIAGELQFVWGNPSDSIRHTVLASTRIWNQVSVPEPGMLALFGLGLAALGFMRRRIN